jgi:hypothetical protein
MNDFVRILRAEAVFTSHTVSQEGKWQGFFGR